MQSTFQGATAMFLLVLLAPFTFAQSLPHCETEFDFLLMEANNSYCWVGQTQHGECHSSQVIQLTFEGSEVFTSVMASAAFDDWTWTKRLSRQIEQDYAVALDPDTNFSYSLIGLKIRNPSYNATLYNEFFTEIYGQCGRQWNEVKGEAGLDLPKISSDKEATLVYYHKEGMYFNYEIESVTYFPDSGYLLIFTSQKQKCGHNASMNGFFIFRLN